MTAKRERRVLDLTHNELVRLVEKAPVFGEWRSLENPNQYQFRSVDGGILNWWSSTKTIMFQGSERGAQELERALFHALVDCARRVLTE